MVIQYKNIVHYTDETSVVNIINDITGRFYSKHCDWQYDMLPEEISVIENAIQKLADELGNIKSETTSWRAVFFGYYIKFEDIITGECVEYFDMNPIDRRYIDLAIQEWEKNRL